MHKTLEFPALDIWKRPMLGLHCGRDAGAQIRILHWPTDGARIIFCVAMSILPLPPLARPINWCRVAGDPKDRAACRRTG